MWSTLINQLRAWWEGYQALVSPFYPYLQWGIGIGAVLLILGWGARRLAPTFHDCPQCGRVIPKRWNPCRMCGYVFEAAPPAAPGGAEAPVAPEAGPGERQG